MATLTIAKNKTHLAINTIMTFSKAVHTPR
jgi:hypothetical protein